MLIIKSFSFNKGTSSSIKYATIMMNHNSTDSSSSNFLLADMQATFECQRQMSWLLDNIIASYAGGHLV